MNSFKCLCGLVAGVGAAVVIGSPVAAQPLLQYSFDEVSGDALDTGTAPQTDGVLTGGAARSTDTPAGFSAASVDLATDNPFAHVLSTDAADLDGLGALTLTTWLKVNEYTSGNNRLVAKQDGGNFGGFSWNMNATTNDGPTSADNFRLALFLGGNLGGDFGFAFSDVDAGASEWTFLAATYDSTTGDVAFYSGGENTTVTQLGTTQNVGVATGLIDAGTARFGVGFTDAAPTADTSVNGLQDDVRVYGSALSRDDLDAIRRSNVPEPASLALLGLGGLAMLRRR